jgi:hypothetical protein
MAQLHKSTMLDIDLANNRNGSFLVPSTGVYFVRAHAANWPAGSSITLNDSSTVRFTALGVGQAGFVTLNSGKASWSTTGSPTGVNVLVSDTPA